VGFVHSVEYELLYAIEQVTGCETKPCFLTPTDFQLQMRQREEGQATDNPAGEIKFDSPQTPAEIARILCTLGVEIEAEEAFIARCREYLWARLKSGAKAVDLLFKVD
jgi:hypothetical protein